MDNWSETVTFLIAAIVLIILNGFFVAAEFALVKIRISRIEQMARDGRAMANTAKWLAVRLDESLSACQLGITMASLGLGWVGEPAFARLVEPLLKMVGIHNEQVTHVLGFIAAFSVITGLHLVVGEQAPKIFAIRRPESMLLWCAAPMKFFFIILYPFLVVLNLVTKFVLGLLGVGGAGGQDGASTEQEIRALLREAHIHGNLTGNEHSLINNVFEFDDMVVRRVMLPRGEVDFFDINEPLEKLINLAKRTKHTRYPACDHSLDSVVGVIHIKDLVGVSADNTEFDIREIIRPPKKVPETMPISRVLRHFQGTHQLLAFVVDEYGTITGIVTLENVLEEIVGSVEDEFDSERPEIVPSGPGEFMIDGGTLVGDIEKRCKLDFGDESDSDSISGLLTEMHQRMLHQGDRFELPGATAVVVETQGDRATLVRLLIHKPA